MELIFERLYIKTLLGVVAMHRLIRQLLYVRMNYSKKGKTSS